MFIVLEGTDASGKSTLAAKISEALSQRGKVAEFHKGKPEELTRRWTLHEYAIDISKENWFAHNAIADRWHWGEVTYAPLKRKETCNDDFGLLGSAGWRWVELFLESRGVAQFWVRQPLDIIVRRLTGRGDDFVSPEELEKILSLYEFGYGAAANMAGIVTPPDHGTDEEIDSVVADIIKTAEEKSNAARHLELFPEYIGPPMPKVLLVGDKRNDPTVTILPFMPVDSNSGDYLMKNLPESFWRCAGIINGDDIGGARLVKLWEAIGRPYIIALGRMAERELRNSGFNDLAYKVVPHPQYVRRFHHRDGVEYGLAIQRLATMPAEIGDPWILP
jgi:hypothetical protein